MAKGDVYSFTEGVAYHHSLNIAKNINKKGVEFCDYGLLYDGICGYSGGYDPESLGYCLVRRLLKNKGEGWLEKAERKSP